MLLQIFKILLHQAKKSQSWLFGLSELMEHLLTSMIIDKQKKKEEEEEEEEE